MGKTIELQHLAQSNHDIAKYDKEDGLDEESTLHDSSEGIDLPTNETSAVAPASLQASKGFEAEKYFGRSRRASISSSSSGLLQATGRQTNHLLEEAPLSSASWHGCNPMSRAREGRSERTSSLLSRHPSRFIFISNRKMIVEPAGSRADHESTNNPLATNKIDASKSSVRECVGNGDSRDRPYICRQASVPSGMGNSLENASVVADPPLVFTSLQGRAMMQKQASARYLKMSQAKAKSCNLKELLKEYDAIVD